MNRLLAAALLSLCAGAAFAGPAPGSYDLYDDRGQRTGRVEVTLSSGTEKGLAITTLESVTTVSMENALGTYRLVERDTVRVSTAGVLSLSRETEENGKRSYVRGERQGRDLLVSVLRNGRTLAFAQPLSSFDMTEFETELPGSVLRRVQPGQSGSARVFYLEDLKPLLTTRAVTQFNDAEFGERRLSVISARNTVNGKTSTLWFDPATGHLLQDEGAGYLLARRVP